MAKRKKIRKYRRRKKGPIFRFLKLVFATITICALLLSILMLINILSDGDIADLIQQSSVVYKKARKSTPKGIDEIEAGIIDLVKKEDAFPTEELVGKVAVASDIHSDFVNLGLLIGDLDARGVSTLFILGDLTNFGEIPSLTEIKDVLDSSGITYYAVSGDHDIAETSNHDNFTLVFGSRHYWVEVGGYVFVVFDNSANFTKIPTEEISWVNQNLGEVDFLLLSQPLYTSCLGFPYSKTYMGSTHTETTDSGLANKQEEVRYQGSYLLDSIRSSKNVKAIIAGDHHHYSVCQDPKRSTFFHYNLGSVSGVLDSGDYTIEVTPSYVILNLYKDGVYKVQNVLLN